MTAIVANQNGNWNNNLMWTPNQIPLSGDDVDLLTFVATLPVDYAGACRSLTGGAGSEIIYSAGSSMTIDDTGSIDYSPEIVTMNGTQAKPAICTSAASGEPTNKIPAGMTTLASTYGAHEHMAAVLKASSLTLVDSEYWFYIGTAPEEQVVAGTWDLTRSVVASYDGERWYVKPTGNDITMVASLLLNAIPSIYSTNFYIVFFQNFSDGEETPRPRVEAEAGFLGSTGEHSEVTGYKSSKVDMEGRISYDDLALWNHPLDHRIFTANLRQLNRDQDEIFAFTWNQGHYAKATLFDFKLTQERGESDVTASRWWKVVVKERPYN